MSREIAIPVRSKDRAGRTVTTYAEGFTCDPCMGTGFVSAKGMESVMDSCRHCNGLGVIVRNPGPLPQIEW